MEVINSINAVNNQVAKEFFPYFRVYKDGRIHRYKPIKKISPNSDYSRRVGVVSKDVIISNDPFISGRLFMPRVVDPVKKLPLLVYFHGGGFSLRSAFDPIYDQHVSSITAEANIVAISIDYRLAPEHPIPICYNDSWAALKWISAHANGVDQNLWLNNYVDFKQTFLLGDSAGANIVHNMLVQLGSNGLAGVKVVGAALIHPYFGGTGVFHNRLWMYLCQANTELQDRRKRPNIEDLKKTGCDKVLVFLCEKDIFKNGGMFYYENLKKSGWRGSVEIFESKGLGHTFHLKNPNSDQALDLMKTLVSFIGNQPTKLIPKV